VPIIRPVKEDPSVRPIRAVFLPPATDLLRQPGQIVLKDGTAAELRIARESDAGGLAQFIDRLSPESKRHRFFSETAPPNEVVASLCDSSDPRSQLTLIAVRISRGRPAVVAAGTYTARDAGTAEVSLAVDDTLHGKGIGTILVEHLALLAVRHGFTQLWAVTHADNLAMREVFRESGFPWHEYVEGGEIEVELSLTPTERTVMQSEWRDRVATVASLRPFFHPRAVAVIGASANPASIGYRLLDAQLQSGFAGPVYPINPHADSLAGLLTYRQVTMVPGPVDLAVIAVPREAVLTVVEQCADKQVRTLVIITAGFAEGLLLERRLVELVRRNGMRMVGPNCFGLLNADPSVRLNATFAPIFPPAGHIAMSSQSGALGLAVLGATRRLHLGVSSFVSVGNKADVSVNDLLQYWEDDPATHVIVLYVESFGNPRRFAPIARRVGRRKPIIAVKAGRSTAGHRAAGSHTAALAASNVAVEALFRQTGLLRAETLDEMLALAMGLSNQVLPKGRRVGIITNAGGPAILCTDACEASGLTVPELSLHAREQLAAFLPATAAVKNPVDLIASATPDQYAQAIVTLMTSQEIDALIFLFISLTPTDTTGIADSIVAGIRSARKAGVTDKPVFLTWMAEGDHGRSFTIDGETIPAYSLPETPARVLGKAALYREWATRPVERIPDFLDMDLSKTRKICTGAGAERSDGWLTAGETRQVLSAVGLPVFPADAAKSAEEAVHTAEQLGFPVAIKLASRTVVHKTDLGGVVLNVGDAAGVRKAYTSIKSRLAEAGLSDAMEGVLVQPMLRGGVEVMIGMTHDPQFGPLMAFGLGGIHVEILGDVQFRITPLTEQDAADMVREIKGSRLLDGYRGQPTADKAALEEALLRISRLVEEIPEIVELDLNPIFALPTGQGCRVVDARIRLSVPYPATPSR
jgi:acyl-CoA synthetase (NDP forming)/GNAT superfamily N-acetyltransferase